MAITKATIAKIQAIANDKRGNPEIRKVALEKLEKYREKYPQLFTKYKQKVEPKFEPKPRPKQEPETKSKYESKDEAEYYSNWRRSAKGNLWRKYGKKTITVFRDKKYGGYKWAIYGPGMKFGKYRYQTEDKAKEYLWRYLNENRI